MKTVHDNFKSFFALLKKSQNGTYDSKVRMPHYLKKDGHFNLLFAEFNVKTDLFQVPMSSAFRKEFGKVLINVPKNLKDKTIKEVRIIPKNNARFFEVQWIYEIPVQEENLNPNNVLAIDLGVDNLCTCVTNHGDAFIVDGKKIKSFNQWANKKNAYLQSIKDKQKIIRTTKNQQKLWRKRNNQVNDYINKSVRHIVDYCRNNDIGAIVIGYNKDLQKNINLGKVNNQNFVNIPIGDLRKKIMFQCQRYAITFIEQEESYTCATRY
jgi:IS605 OrfB family transposase